jgi:hypothetical protein
MTLCGIEDRFWLGTLVLLCPLGFLFFNFLFAFSPIFFQFFGADYGLLHRTCRLNTSY